MTKNETEERATTTANTHKPLTYALRSVDDVGLTESHEV